LGTLRCISALNDILAPGLSAPRRWRSRPTVEPEIHRVDPESGSTLRLFIGISSQTAGSTCEFWVNPVNFTFWAPRDCRSAASAPPSAAEAQRSSSSSTCGSPQASISPRQPRRSFSTWRQGCSSGAGSWRLLCAACGSPSVAPPAGAASYRSSFRGAAVLNTLRCDGIYSKVDSSLNTSLTFRVIPR
jgi:hypothetical protein